MRPISDYESLLQLGVALNLVLGGYSTYRHAVEDNIENIINRSLKQIDEIKDIHPPSQGPIRHGLESGPIKDLTLQELSRYLGDVSIRFYQRCSKYGSMDKPLSTTLMVIGFLCMIALTYSSLWPKTKISYAWIYPGCAITLLPSSFALVRALHQTSQHEKFRRREPNDSMKAKVKDNQAERIRTTPRIGEISRVVNVVRTKYADLERKKNSIYKKDHNI